MEPARHLIRQGAVIDSIEIRSATGSTRLAARGELMTIGRALDNTIVLSDEPEASRYHAELLVGDGTDWLIRDLDSRNGTWLNGVKLLAPTAFSGGDVIGIGGVTLRRVTPDPVVGTVQGTGALEGYRLLGLLSERELEVLAQVAAGRTDDQAANALFISVKTVHSHLAKIKEKTGVRRRADLTRLAVRLGLPPVTP